jgi:hypothetical protein
MKEEIETLIKVEMNLYVAASRAARYLDNEMRARHLRDYQYHALGTVDTLWTMNEITQAERNELIKKIGL